MSASGALARKSKKEAQSKTAAREGGGLYFGYGAAGLDQAAAAVVDLPVAALATALPFSYCSR
jgi:hypothetical protein